MMDTYRFFAGIIYRRPAGFGPRSSSSRHTAVRTKQSVYGYHDIKEIIRWHFTYEVGYWDIRMEGGLTSDGHLPKGIHTCTAK
jgi:hypothetical protein